MEIYERLSRALMRRKYARLEGSQFVVARRARVRVARLQDAAAPKRRAHRLTLRRFGLHLVSPARLMASLRGAYMRLQARTSSASSAPAKKHRPARRTFRSSSNEVVDEVWFNHALRRSIAEGRLSL